MSGNEKNGYNRLTKSSGDYVGYDYKTVTADSDKASMLLDSYACFGWLPNSRAPETPRGKFVTLSLKRERKIANKAELTRLQQHFEACFDMLDKLENSSARDATIYSLTTGLIGTAFIAGSVFMVTSEPPLILYCVLLGAPGLVCWAAAYPIFRLIREKRAAQTVELLEKKYDEMHEICAKGATLIR